MSTPLRATLSALLAALLLGSLAACSAKEPPDLSDIPSMNIGSEMPYLLYADQATAVLQGTCGVVVYSLEQRAVTHRLSFKALQELGLVRPFARVSQDGGTLNLAEDDPQTGLRFLQAYDLATRRVSPLAAAPSDLFPLTYYADSSGGALVSDLPDLESLVGDLVVERDGDLFFLCAASDWSMQSLALVRQPLAGGESAIYPVFAGN